MLLGTWNLENLYRPGGPYGPRDGVVYEAKLAALAATLEALGPTVLGIQEVGDPEALQDLVGLLPGTWHTALSEHPDGRGIRVGFLSRHPLDVVSDAQTFPQRLRAVQSDDSADPTARMGRGALAVRVEPDDGPQMWVAVCHLKSKLLTFPGNRFQPHDEGERARYAAYALFRRGAEAVTLRSVADELLEEQGKERAVVVLGDLNDEPAAATTQILHGPPGSEIGTPGFLREDKGDAMRLWNVAQWIPEDRRYSRVHAGRPELIDHILISHQLLDRVAAAGTGIVGAAEPPPLPSVDEVPTERRDATGSDHAPVWIRLGD
ncbi:endonuclease/exonuclease/phosphatase family protein [Streptomyces sp. NBC_00306]|uniref:endonuclease/exonuclease/phosphatase family protein n=1 Tax=Streptomyces sp. NBC_00306 TaxID=2975708 RepID=UPI002E2E1CA7|nr:endonuclease/exonuclease/phosphatase family protein [Streptomyces sp. NBC_00306]